MNIPLRNSTEKCLCCTIDSNNSSNSNSSSNNNNNSDNYPTLDDYGTGTVKISYNNINNNIGGATDDGVYVPTSKNEMLIVKRKN